MRRILLACLTALATAVALAFSPASEVKAVPSAEIVGSYRLRMKGDGWMRGTSDPYRAEKIAGGATLLITRVVPDDGRLHVEILLDPALDGSLLDLATPEPAFVGDAALVGDSLTVIDTGGPTYVNVLTMTFMRQGAKIVGHWISSFPAADPDSGAAAGIGVDFTGKRRRGRSPNAR